MMCIKRILFKIFRSRHEYLKLLVNDLMTYYSYNEYFMEYLVNLFPGGEVCCFICMLKITSMILVLLKH